MKFRIAIVVLAFVALSGCEKVLIGRLEDNLPEKTTVGVGTFGCIINGEVWLPQINRDISPFKDETSLFMDEASGTIRITANYIDFDQNGQPFRETIIIDAVGIKDEGSYELSSEPLIWDSTVLFIDNELDLYGGAAVIEQNSVRTFQSTGKLKGKVRPLFLDIKRLDFENGICSGTFEFLAHNYINLQKILKKDVKKGRFDLQMGN